MTRYAVRASVAPAFREAVSTALLRRWARLVLGHLDLPAGTAVEIAVTDDGTVQQLNRTHRGLDELTDVLAFPYTHRASTAPYYGAEPRPAQELADFVVPPRAASLLGEVVIAFPQAERQAAAAGHPTPQELALLLVHGMLHLLGYDHQKPAEEQRMGAETARLLGMLLT